MFEMMTDRVQCREFRDKMVLITDRTRSVTYMQTGGNPMPASNIYKESVATHAES